MPFNKTTRASNNRKIRQNKSTLALPAIQTTHPPPKNSSCSRLLITKSRDNATNANPSFSCRSSPPSKPNKTNLRGSRARRKITRPSFRRAYNTYIYSAPKGNRTRRISAGLSSPDLQGTTSPRRAKLFIREKERGPCSLLLLLLR